MSLDSPELYPLIGSLVGDAMAFGRDDGGWSVHSAAALACAVGMVQPSYNILTESPGPDYINFVKGNIRQELNRINVYVPYRSNESYTWERIREQDINQGLNLIGVIYMKYENTTRIFENWPLSNTRSILISTNESDLTLVCGRIIMTIILYLKYPSHSMAELISYLKSKKLELLVGLLLKDQNVIIDALDDYNNFNSLPENHPIFSLKLLLQCLTKCNSFTEGIEYIKARCQNKLSCAMNGAIYGQVAGMLYANDHSRGIPLNWLHKLPFRSMIGVLSLSLAKKKFSPFFEVTDWSQYKKSYKFENRIINEDQSRFQPSSVIDFYHKIMEDKKPKDKLIKQIKDLSLVEDIFAENQEIEGAVQEEEIEFAGFEKFLVVDINETVKSWDTGVLNLDSSNQRQNFTDIPKGDLTDIAASYLLKNTVAPTFLPDAPAAPAPAPAAPALASQITDDQYQTIALLQDVVMYVTLLRSLQANVTFERAQEQVCAILEKAQNQHANVNDLCVYLFQQLEPPLTLVEVFTGISKLKPNVVDFYNFRLASQCPNANQLLYLLKSGTSLLNFIQRR